MNGFGGGTGAEVGALDQAKTNFLFRSPVSAAGDFRVALPTLPASETISLPSLLSGCSMLAGADPALQLRVLNNYPVFNGSTYTLLGVATERPAGDTSEGVGSRYADRLYADRDSVLVGKSTCADGSTIDFNMHLRKGWNVVERRVISLDAQGDAASLTLRDWPSGQLASMQYTPYQPGFTANLSGTDLTVQQGGQVQLPLAITADDNFKGAVALSLQDAPAGLSLDVGQVSVQSAQSAPLLRALSKVSQPSVSLRASASTVPGSYTPTLVLSAGGTTRRLPFPLTVKGPTFALSASEAKVYAGELANIAVNLSPVLGFSGPVTLELADAPPGVHQDHGVTVNLGANPVAVNLPISADQRAVPDDFKVKVSGRSGILLQQAQIVL